MDSIVLCNSNTLNYERYENQPGPKKSPLLLGLNGVVGWRTTGGHSGRSRVWVKINCHELMETTNLAGSELEQIKVLIDARIGKMGMDPAQFNISRIDYDYNFRLGTRWREALLEMLHGLPERVRWMEKSPVFHSIYYACKSRHVQLYDKVHERKEKGRDIKPWEADICRQEVQCHYQHIYYMKRYHGLLPTWENWVNLDMQAYYLRKARPIFLQGDFYSLDRAIELVKLSGLPPVKAKRLCKDLEIVAKNGLDAMKSGYCQNTYIDHMECFANLNISPLTLPREFEYLEKINNPFFK